MKQHSFLRRCGLVITAIAVSGICSARDKKDVIQLVNGDRITCEIVKLEKGYLYVKLGYVDGTVAMDWSKIVSIESPQHFVVADKSGNRYLGSVQNVAGEDVSTNAEKLRLQVQGAADSTIVDAKEVVEIRQTETTFWQNLHGGLDAGVNYAKQQNRTQYNFQSNLLFERTKWLATANYESSFSGGGDLTDARNDLRMMVTKQWLSPRNSYVGLADFLQSDEQQLDLRTALGGALGHMFTHTNKTVVFAYAGLDWNRERYFPQSETHAGNSAEAVLGTQLNFFRFKTTNILVDERLYPSLTDAGRIRFDLNTSLKLKLAKDLYWRFGYYLNYDSRPPRNVPMTDYGSTSSLGWTF
jgi:hypothetical protein